MSENREPDDQQSMLAYITPFCAGPRILVSSLSKDMGSADAAYMATYTAASPDLNPHPKPRYPPCTPHYASPPPPCGVGGGVVYVGSLTPSSTCGVVVGFGFLTPPLPLLVWCGVVWCGVLWCGGGLSVVGFKFSN